MTQDFDSAGDIRLKGKVMVDLVIISKINLKQQCSAVRKKEVGQLCSICGNDAEDDERILHS